MDAVTSHDTHTITVMAGTQIVKTELLNNTAAYFIAQDPAPILFVQPSQGVAKSFSKERFAPMIATTKALRERISPSKSRDSDNTIESKVYPGGAIHFVGANSPSDLASRPKRIILCDEIDKYPLSAGTEGDPLKLAEERASTYHALGRAKFVRTCSPTIKGVSRIEREYNNSDMRLMYVACPHCGFEQTLEWANVRWDKDETGASRPETAAIACSDCGVVWTERERIEALEAVASRPDYGWRQTKPFSCCGVKQEPSQWNAKGRSLCVHCGETSPYTGHAGFRVSKLYSARHRLSIIVQEFLDAQGDQEALKKFTNTALAELWEPRYTESFDSAGLMKRAETYDGDDLPEAVKVVTGFCDVQGDRLEVQLVAWGTDEEAWPFRYEIIHQDPAQPKAWQELDVLLAEKFRTVSGRILRVAAFGIDTGGHHHSQVLSFCSARRARRIFACKGIAGPKPIWPGRATRSKTNHALFLIGVDSAKEAIYARLNITAAEPGQRKPGYIHFPVTDNFGPEYFEQLNSERRVVRKRNGQPYAVWEQIRARNEALDTLVGALAMRKSLPRFIESSLEYSVAADRRIDDPTPTPVRVDDPADESPVRHQSYAAMSQRAPGQGWVGAGGGWMNRR